MPIEHVQFITSDNKDFITSDNRNFFVKDVVPPPPPPPVGQFSINLYINTAEPARVDKTDHLSGLGTINGTLREATDIINPIIMIEYEELPTFNYISIEAFNRYYYVRNIVSVYNNLWAIECECDVLMSYKEYIQDLRCIVSRQESDEMCLDAATIPDNLLPLDNSYEINKYEFPNTPFNTETLSGSAFNIAICVVGKGLGDASQTMDVGRNIHNPNFKFPNGGRFSNIYVTNIDGLSQFLDAIWDTDIWRSLEEYYNEPLEQIISIKIYPFDLRESNSSDVDRGITIATSVTVGMVTLFSTSGQTTFYQMNSNYNCIYDFGYIRVENEFDLQYLAYAPYTDMYLYLPYVGTVPINPIEVINRRLSVEYAVDFSTGNCTAYVYSGTGNPMLIQTAEGVIGQDMPYSAINGAAISKERVRTIINAISGVTQTALGVASLALLI